MRKLVYVGKDNVGNVIETADFKEKTYLEGKGFTFTEKMVEIVNREKPDLERIAKIRAKIMENKAKKAKAKEA